LETATKQAKILAQTVEEEMAFGADEGNVLLTRYSTSSPSKPMHLTANVESTNSSLPASRCLLDIDTLALVRFAFAFAVSATNALDIFMLAVTFAWPANGVSKSTSFLESGTVC